MTHDDPRLPVIYDVDNPDGPDHDFFRQLADESGATDIVDLGCGTGILTVTLARPGRRVVGIDPAPTMLDRAARRPGGDQVTWLLGTAEQVQADSADLVLMTGNVAMHIVGDDWPSTLACIARGLRPGGTLAFETRNPEARAWEGWNFEPAVRDTPVGPLRESLVTDPPDERGVVVMHCRTEFLDDATVVDIDQHLQFRSHARVVHDLKAAGLRVEATYCDWAGNGFRGGHDQPLMVFVAART